jgi:hypothetical protein
VLGGRLDRFNIREEGGRYGGGVGTCIGLHAGSSPDSSTRFIVSLSAIKQKTNQCCKIHTRKL